MIYTYGITLTGKSHVKAGSDGQDSHKIIKCAEGFVVAAVADGLGSELYSGFASALAVETAVGYCAGHIGSQMDLADSDIEAVIHASFTEAQDGIEAEAAKNGHAPDQYDTTLSLAVLLGGRLHFGHSGDSGIVALCADGLYEKVTEQQRDDYCRVFPLAFREKWVVGTFCKSVASVFLSTDGIYETLFPLYIRKEPVNIYVSLAKYFMDNQSLRIEEYGENETQKRVGSFMESIPESQVDDDITVVVLVNADVVPGIQPDEYYKDPDWKELKRKMDEEWRRLAYPHLYENAGDEGGIATDNATGQPCAGET